MSDVEPPELSFQMGKVGLGSNISSQNDTKYIILHKSMGSYHFYNNSLAIARILLCRLTRIYLTMGLLSYLPAIFTVLFSLLPSDCYSIAGDFHRAIFVIYPAIVTEQFSQY